MKLPFWATIFSVLGFVFLSYLGVWQINRMHWKSGILEAINKEYEIDAEERNLAEFLKDQNYFKSDYGVRRGYLMGRFEPDKSLLLGPRVYDKMPGYHLITPFKIEENSHVVILVNRGWVPADYDIDKEISGAERQKITGIMMAPYKDNMFVPDNNPEKEEWFRLDYKNIRASRNIENLIDLVLYEEKNGKQLEKYPISTNIFVRPNNNHMHYASFWFIMALVLAVVYSIRFAGLRKSTWRSCG
ncbi:MAG: SURF1 family protein [Alphaproteobacteria bacterium]|nr:SURF1 family protein [Alphaproteobacteria bacterium]